MSRYTIGETARRSGFSTSALRYYEDIGLVVPEGRNEAGYRLYNEALLAQLGFVARAKQLGCSLDEVRDLVAIWDRERCGPVQRRLHELVTAKLTDARGQIVELTAFVAQLEAAAAHLAGPAVDGPCGDECACSAATIAETPDAVPVAPSRTRDSWRAAAPSSVGCTRDPRRRR